MDTAPLPRVQGPPGDGVPRSPVTPAPGGALRFLEAVAGLLAGGLLVVGLVLVAMELLAPELAPGTGLAVPAGPGWGRIAAHLAAGVAGEVTVLARRHVTRPIRAVLAVAVIVAVAVVLWLGWWS